MGPRWIKSENIIEKIELLCLDLSLNIYLTFYEKLLWLKFFQHSSNFVHYFNKLKEKLVIHRILQIN